MLLAAAGDLEDSVWLDLYAGTGAVGIEALSRGARQVYFVESDKKHARLLRENLASLGISIGYELHEREVAQALPLLDSTGVVCDYVFLDPPYRMRGSYERTLGYLSQSRLLQPINHRHRRAREEVRSRRPLWSAAALPPAGPGRCCAQLLSPRMKVAVASNSCVDRCKLERVG